MVGQGRGGGTLVILLKEGGFFMFLVAIGKITARLTKFMSLTLVGLFTIPFRMSLIICVRVRYNLLRFQRSKLCSACKL